jgi:hypothetical protein
MCAVPYIVREPIVVAVSVPAVGKKGASHATADVTPSDQLVSSQASAGNSQQLTVSRSRPQRYFALRHIRIGRNFVLILERRLSIHKYLIGRQKQLTLRVGTQSV